jgi:sugar/nucleoside kinase (ribokinase family)
MTVNEADRGMKLPPFSWGTVEERALAEPIRRDILARVDDPYLRRKVRRLVKHARYWFMNRDDIAWFIAKERIDERRRSGLAVWPASAKERICRLEARQQLAGEK